MANPYFADYVNTLYERYLEESWEIWHDSGREINNPEIDFYITIYEAMCEKLEEERAWIGDQL